MATDALRSQVATKWQEAFNRINRGEPGISGLMTFSQAWSLATDYLRPKDLGDPSPQKEYDMIQVRAAFDMVNQCKRLPMMLEAFLDDMREHFYLIIRELNGYLTEYERDSDPLVIGQLIRRLEQWYKAWSPIPELGTTITSAYTVAFQTHLFSVLPQNFSQGFRTLCEASLPPSDGSSSFLDPSIWLAIDTLGFIDRYESIIASVAFEYIEAHVVSTCAKKWAEPMLSGLRDWMINKIAAWMRLPYGRPAASQEETRLALQGVASRFDFHMNKTLCDLRIKEIFDIIIDFPDSLGGLYDLRECMQHVDQRATLIRELRKAHKKRLLHPGADTKLILSQYVATIKCLRIIDPPGVLLFKVADPIRRYLRERPDTIRCIVANLVGDDESGDALVDENEPIQPLQNAEIEDYIDPNWEPEPIDAGPEFRTNKPSDIISTLVSIYDSKDLFVKELQVLLAQRLLAIKDGNFEKERRNIEILKVRFGEAALQVCEVMLKDMTDSQRIDQHVQSQQASIVHPMIISRHFWPKLESSGIVMPGQFQELQDQYAHGFSTFKPDKKLRWLPHLGTVNLEIELEDRVVTADVPPLEAAFIELFSDKNVWTMDELTSRVGPVDRGAALKALVTWVDLGVLKEDKENTFTLLEIAEESRPSAKDNPLPKAAPEADESLPVAAVEQQQAEQMKVFWKFIEGMLTNLGPLPLDRIQTMLRFAPGYDRSTDELAAFMEAARRQGLVTVRDGIWRLGR